MVTNGFYCDAEFIVAICHSFIKICCPLKCPENLDENPKLHNSTSVLATVSEGKSFILCGYSLTGSHTLTLGGLRYTCTEYTQTGNGHFLA
jgi:hypothetical protein